MDEPDPGGDIGRRSLLRAGTLSSIPGVLAGCLSHGVEATATPVGLRGVAAREANYEATPRVRTIETVARGRAGPFTRVTASITSYVVRYAVAGDPDAGAPTEGPDDDRDADVLTFFATPDLSVGGQRFNGMTDTDFPGLVASRPALFAEFCACSLEHAGDLTVRRAIEPTATRLDGDTDMYVVPGSAVGAVGDVTLLGHRVWPSAITATFLPDAANGTAYYVVATAVRNETADGRDAVFASFVGRRGLLSERNFAKGGWRLLSHNGEGRTLFKNSQVDAFNRRFLSVLGAAREIEARARRA